MGCFFFFFSTLLLLNSPTSHAMVNPIKTVVVLVMENRSFDHMLGWMKKFNPDINGVNGSESNVLSVTDPNSQRFFFKNQAQYVDPDPGHSFQAIREQIFGSNDTSADPAPMNGFAQQAYSMDNTTNMSQNVMNGFDPDMVAVYKTLVSEFAVFDRWFASMPASTQPNRLYVHSATSHGATSNVASLLIKGYPQQTIFDNLHDAGFDFGIYYQNIPATLFYKNLRKLKYLTKFHPYDLSFKQHAKAGKLPSYVVVEQRYTDTKLFPGNDDHPSHDVYQGQMFVKEVYETLRASPQWNETLFVITYDEHGGFYDHVSTPVRGVPSPDGIVGPEPFNFTFDRLGVRVPTIAISPWIEKGTVVHGPNGSPSPTSEYEHSSIPATVKKLFNLPSFLTRRDEWAGTFEGIVQTRTEPRNDCPEQLPTPVKIRKGDPNEDAKLSEFQQELIQLAAVLKGDNVFTSYPNTIGKDMTVKQGKDYMEDAVRRFFEAGRYAKKMGMSSVSRTTTSPDLGYRPNHFLQRIPPRIPILGDVEIVYHDDRGWQVDHSRFFMTYIGLVSLYIRMGEGPYFHLDGPYRISQRLPFSEMWYPPRQREFPDDMWNMVDRSVARSGVGMVQRGRRQRSVQTMYNYRHRRVVMSSDESVWEPRTRYGRVYRRHYGEGEGSSRRLYRQ